MTSDPRTMDLRLQGNPQLHYGVNGGAGRSSRPSEDDALKFLSQEEQECIQFFEETIDSLEDSLEENDRRPRQVKPLATVDGRQTTSALVSSLLGRSPSPKDQDIIYLVRPEPDLVQTKEPNFSPTTPDFQSMVQNPESHFEVKPRRDPDSLPSEYNAPLPSFGQTDSQSSYHPPGCIPTPVLIAQQIAENQAGGTSNLHPSTFLRRCSLESDKPVSHSSDLHSKQGPPTSARPTRFPANINVILGNKEHQNQQLANVSIQERRAQMLANLTGTSHPLLQENLQPPVEEKARNAPTRSISFKDPSPDKSRMEALSKLGLSRNRAMSGGVSLLADPNSSSLDSLTAAETSAKPLEASDPPTAETSIRVPEANVTAPLQSLIDRKPEILPTDSLKRYEDRNLELSPSPPVVTQRKPEILRTDSLKRYEDRNLEPSPSPPAVTQSSYSSPPLENKPSFSPPPEVTLVEFNSYGGKSIMVNPSLSSRSEPATFPASPEPKTLPPALANPSEFNHYGGKTKVMTPALVVVTRSDLPDILSSHIDKSHSLPAKSEPQHIEIRSYGVKSRTINPSAGVHRPSESLTKSVKAPAPTPAPRPPRHSYHGAVAPQKPVLHEHKRRSTSLFRPQGITVQFSGRGATDESRREALRKLGLLKDS